MTLTEAARLTRKVAFWGILIAVSVIFIRIGIGFGIGLYHQFLPPPSPPPTVNFGKITQFDFSQNVVTSSAGVSYAIQTIEGGLPNLGEQGKVFKVIQARPSILFGEQAREQAKKLGFAPKPKIITERLYAFEDPIFKGRRLELDIISGNFKITNDFNQYPELLQMGGVLRPENAIAIAKNFLSSNGRLQKDFTDEKIITTLLKIEGGRLVRARSLAETQLIRVSFYRADLEKLPILAPDFEKPSVWVEVTPFSDFARQILQASYFYWLIDPTVPASYPIKSTKNAFEELIAGRGILVGENLPTLEIRRVSLAYLETAAPMFFISPVYVFSGDNFTAFVPAVSFEWIAP